MRYLTGGDNPTMLPIAYTYDIGLMVSPPNMPKSGSEWPYFAADNGCFSRIRQFDTDIWITWLKSLVPQQSRCLFAVAPDVVGDSVATYTRSMPLIPVIRDLGYHVAYVAQDGLTIETTPWDQFEWLFIGGPNAFKLGPEVPKLIKSAKQRGKSVHMGRVNTYKRLLYAARLGCDSADGGWLNYGMGKHLPRLTRYLRSPALLLPNETHSEIKYDHEVPTDLTQFGYWIGRWYATNDRAVYRYAIERSKEYHRFRIVFDPRSPDDQNELRRTFAIGYALGYAGESLNNVEKREELLV